MNNQHSKPGLVLAFLTLLSCSITNGQVVNLSDTHPAVSLSIRAKVYTKKISASDFSVRHFHLLASQNPDNAAYGWDWRIVEDKDSFRVNLLYVAQTHVLYSSNHPEAGIRHCPRGIPPGQYAETMRYYLLPDEWLHPVEELYGDDQPVSWNEIPGNLRVLQVNLNETARRELVFEKGKPFPIQVTETLRDTVLQDSQVIQIQFENIRLNAPLPDSALSIQHVLDQGYAPVEYVGPSTEKSEARLTAEQVRLLWQAPLLGPNGDTLLLRQPDARAYLIDFWYASCAPCLKALPEMQALHEAYRPQGVHILALNAYDQDQRLELSQKLRARGFTFPVRFAPPGLIRKLNIPAYPYYLLLDAEGRLHYAGWGGLQKLREQIEALL